MLKKGDIVIARELAANKLPIGLVLQKIETKEYYLIGNINQEGGTCGGCCNILTYSKDKFRVVGFVNTGGAILSNYVKWGNSE